ncbi:Gfo/Idh/MocA family protein [Flagellimonas sp.]|uniref:Gfo/Idh/MocA family protein n=1 Tax=Flagellimonas sp. TaxID=2058762 RepID=UPI003BB1B30E
MHELKDDRRNFMKSLGILGTGILTGCLSNKEKNNTAWPGRASGAEYMGTFSAPPLEKVRCAFIGVGARGFSHVDQFAEIKGVEVVAICDLHKDLVNAAEKACKEKHGQNHQNIAKYYGGQNLWRIMLEEVKPDAVFISTPWHLHAPMAITTMEQGAHAFLEVPLATSINDLWRIVDTSEKTRKHCMMMENCNYGRDELLFLNMCNQGVIGDLLHGEAAYIHELRWQMNEENRGTGSWRTYEYAKHNGNLYPTHGLGPVSQYMNLSRSKDTFSHLVSLSSPAIGRKKYAIENYSSDHKWTELNFKAGDINTTIIKTVIGKTIMVQWDETSPRPYTRLNMIQGTKGVLAGFPTRIALENGIPGITEDFHKWAQGDQLQLIYDKYEHPLYKRLGSLAAKRGGHGGMDFIMRYRIIECLRKGEPLDQNLYEGCFWSAVVPLTELSVAKGGAPEDFPDFTRGNWKKTLPVQIVT